MRAHNLFVLIFIQKRRGGYRSYGMSGPTGSDLLELRGTEILGPPLILNERADGVTSSLLTGSDLLEPRSTRIKFAAAPRHLIIRGGGEERESLQIT